MVLDYCIVQKKTKCCKQTSSIYAHANTLMYPYRFKKNLKKILKISRSGSKFFLIQNQLHSLVCVNVII
ncbi:hypothetical protein DERP_012114 [Dermatophagoides pteronyssinus]|uniref:Uncharacterized protein n=1 Tax=Dermatophagoides pteronyssinus TaxID=6956 RepID=A0ABQ8ITY9_DERPT|nr:hypothetical protein DERP_012114 [Dermatophagoides pteronyssinus]